MDNDEQLRGLGRRLFYWWADHPAAHLLVLLSMSSLAIIGYVKPSLVRDIFVSREAEEVQLEVQPAPVAQEASQNKPPPHVQPFQVAGGECIVVATSEDFFTMESLTAIRNVVADLEALPQVSRVLWLDSIPGLNLFGLPESLLPLSSASPRQMQVGRQRALGNPLAVGQLISTDGKTLLLHLRMDWFQATTDEACTTDLRETAEAAAATVPGADLQFQITGPAPLHLMMARNHLHDSWRYQLIGYSIMIVTAMVLFRGFSAVTIVACAPAMGVFWTMGMLHFFDLQDNPFNDIIVPVLISLVGLTDAVHLMVEIRNQRAAGLETRQATQRGVARVARRRTCRRTNDTVGVASGVAETSVLHPGTPSSNRPVSCAGHRHCEVWSGV